MILGGSSSSANAADGDEGSYGDVLDEAAERAAFQEAVAGWRGSGGRVQIVREKTGDGEKEINKDTGKVDGGGQTDSSMWRDPFGSPLLNDSLEEDDERHHQGTKADSRGKENSNKSSSLSNSKQPSIAANNKIYSLPFTQVGGSSLAHGILDEATEHEVSKFICLYYK